MAAILAAFFAFWASHVRNSHHKAPHGANAQQAEKITLPL